MAVRVESQAEPIPGYRLLERLGGGGFGEVWKAEAPGGLHKAIKFVYGDLQKLGEEGQRAEQELKALSRVKTVRHPYILSLERFEVIEGQLIIVMELADKNLWDRFKECRAAGLAGIPRDELLGYMEETAEALDLMNRQYDLQHLDIKPQNLFLVFNHVKVADFGLVKDLEGMQASVTGGVTPVYAAPETFDGWVSRYSDQYSLAIVYQELLTGQRPFTGGNVRQLVLQHLQAPPNLSSLAAPEQPIIARALAKNPDDRFPTCSELVAALKSVGGPVRPPREFIPVTPSTGAEPQPVPDSEPGTIRLGRLTEPPKPPETHPVSSSDTDEPVSAPPEQTGDGVLFPSLVVGVGQTGLAVLQRLRRSLHQRFGNLGMLPNLRFLYLDTDPEVLRSATAGLPDRPGGDPSSALSSQEIVLAPLNRPAHYLRAFNGRPAVGTWFNPRMLYRIPRTQVTLGCRALGRLAFVDHYRSISRRMRQELEACVDPQALLDAERYTGLGLRTNRPRVYVVAGLGGGTGGGMFLDLAYVLRAQLRQLGYAEPDLVGVLLTPAPEALAPVVLAEEPVAPRRTPSRRGQKKTPVVVRNTRSTLALGNAVASLLELNYFGAPENTFFARYHEHEPPLRDAEPPFNRCVVLPLESLPGSVCDTPAPKAVSSQAPDLAAEFLSRDLCSPLGRTADLGRADLVGPPWPQRGLFYSTFGLYCLASPHRALIQELAREMCADLVERWMTKDATPVKVAAAEWAESTWEREGWAPKDLSQRLQETAEVILAQPAQPARRGEEPDEAPALSWEQTVSKILGPVVVQLKSGGGREHVKDARERDRLLPADVPHVREAMEQIEALVGWPAQEETVGRTAVLPQGLRSAVDGLVGGWGDRVAELVVRLIEQPGYRLSGAEEVVRQIVAKVEAVLQALEPRAKELAKTVADTHARIRTLLDAAEKSAPEGGRGLLQSRSQRPPVLVADVLELVRCYAQWRFDDLLRQELVSAYVSLRGHWSDELREINFCRVRLTELHQVFVRSCARRQQQAAEPEPARTAQGRHLAAAQGRENGRAEVNGHAPKRPEAEPPSATGRRLFPAGCCTLVEAVEQYLENVTAEDLAELDGLMQQMIRRDFRALVYVCLTSANMLKDFEQAMQHEAEAFVGPRLAGTDPAELFLTQAGDDGTAVSELQAVYDEAAPPTQARVLGQQAPEVTVLMAPPGPDGQRLRILAAEAFGGTPPLPAEGGDDVVLYREAAHLPLAEFETLQAVGQEAYRHMCSLDNFTPHTRTDITFPNVKKD